MKVYGYAQKDVETNEYTERMECYVTWAGFAEYTVKWRRRETVFEK
jgi:hypothetical protein